MRLRHYKKVEKPKVGHGTSMAAVPAIQSRPSMSDLSMAPGIVKPGYIGLDNYEYRYDPGGFMPVEKKRNWRDEFRLWKLQKQREPGKGARRVMAQKVRKNEPQFCTKLQSERIVSYLSQHPTYKFSGSSFDRLLKQVPEKTMEDLLIDAKQLHEKGIPVFEEKQGTLFPSFDEEQRQSVAASLRIDQANKSKTTRRMAGSDDGKKYGIHVLSPRSKAKVRAKITEFFAWCRREKKQCTFLTLTFISGVSDGLAIKILNKFLTSVRQEVGDGFQYIRVAERQTKNKDFPNNIHFHLILDRPINIIRFNSLWVVAQYNAGLVAMSRQLDMFITKEEIIKRHEKTMQLYQEYKAARLVRDYPAMKKITELLKENAVGKLFNPVDIKKISTPRTLAGYLTKYVTKNDAQFRCLAWSCSRGVSQMFTATMVPLKVWEEAGSEVNSYVSKEGELIQSEPYTDEKKITVTLRIFNRNHFDEYLNEMRQLNVWILSGKLQLTPQLLTRRAPSEYHLHFDKIFVWRPGIEYDLPEGFLKKIITN